MPSLTRSSKNQVYLDHNATTPPDPQVLSRLAEWTLDWGNPSSIHQAGRGPKARLREARDAVAKMLGVHALEVVFTSGGSESNNLALKGALMPLLTNGNKRHILSSGLEHPSVRRSLEALAKLGFEVELVPVDRSGAVAVDEVRKRLRPSETALVSFMLVNNETGVIQPVQDIAREAHAAGALVHTDAVQALGRIEINLRELGVDMASFSSHKFYALRGAGVLYVARGTSIMPLIHGGGQERHRRGGTENTLAIASLGAMCERASEVEARANKMRELRDHFERRVIAEISDVSVTGSKSERVASTSSLLINGVDGETLLMSLDLEGYSVSTGAACSSGSPEPSPVLLAMGLTREEAQCSLRIGLGWSNTLDEINGFVDALKQIVIRLREMRSRQHEVQHACV